MQKSKLFIAVFAIVSCAGTTSAQSLIYTSTQTAASPIGGTSASGLEGLGGLAEGKVTFTDVSGDSAKGSYECVSMVSKRQ